jgi:hypothetical protein
MEQAERAEAIIDHDLRGSPQARAGRRTMDVRGSEQLRAEHQRGERDDAQSRAAWNFALCRSIRGHDSVTVVESRAQAQRAIAQAARCGFGANRDFDGSPA